MASVATKTSGLINSKYRNRMELPTEDLGTIPNRKQKVDSESIQRQRDITSARVT